MSVLAAYIERATAGSLTPIDLANAVQAVRASAGAAGVKQLYDAWLAHNGQDPLLYAVLFNYGVFLTDTGDLVAARVCLERAVGVKPDFMPSYINLGRIYERLGSTELAVRQWNEVTRALAD